ncbi:MAG: TIGR01777 family oxidoreductase [Bacteroidota bacterium]
MIILITGGTGFIGNELRQNLLQQGHNLIIVTRSPKKYSDEHASNQRFISWDDDLGSVMEETDAVINLAGSPIFGERWNSAVKQDIYDSRIQATRAIVTAIEKAESKPEVLVSASGSGIYGSQADTILDESKPAADDFLATVCVDWEAEAKKAEAFGVRVAIARIGIVLEKNGGALEKMIPPFQLFAGGPVGNGKQYMSWVHREDICNALIYPIEQKELSGAYNICSPNPSTMNEFAKTLGSIMNRPSIFRVPVFVLNVMYGEAAQPITDSIRMQPKALQVTGFEFRYEELEEALADIFEH